jgi:hypothetical protein
LKIVSRYSPKSLLIPEIHGTGLQICEALSFELFPRRRRPFHHVQGNQEMSLESEALISAAEELMHAVEFIKEARKAFDDLPAAQTDREADTRGRLRAALAETHLSMLMAPITMCAVAKKLSIVPHH